MWLAGGYGDDHTKGIYKINHDQMELLVCGKGTSYFDLLDDKIVTIENKEGKGRISLYKDHNCIAYYEWDYKPGCHVKVINDKIWLAHYHAGCVQIFDHYLNLLHTIQYEKGKCHYVFCWKQYVGVVELEADLIHFYNDNYQEVFKLCFKSGAGIRHVCISKDENWLYAISEYSKEIFVVDMNKKEVVQSIDMLLEPSDIATGAAIKLSEDGSHLYASSRYVDQITHFEVKDNLLVPMQYYKTNGKVPRDFEIHDHEVMIGYQDSDFIELVQLDANNNLTYNTKKYNLSKIVCVKFVE